MNDMPMFDDPSPAPQEAPGPKKPRPKPAKKRKVRKAAKVAATKPVKKVTKKRIANKKDFVVPVTKKSLREMSPIEFFETVVGIALEPWQRRIMAAYLEKDK